MRRSTMKEIKIALIPAYKPSATLIELSEKLSSVNFSIVIVDDGSGPQYAQIFKSCEKYAKVLSYSLNKGKGYALKHGLKYIEENYHGKYYIVTMDADGQHTVKDAEKLINYCFQNSSSLVLGKRMRDPKVPLRSRIGNGITRFIYRLVTKVNIYDTQTGLRAFSNLLVDKLLEIEGDRYEYEINVLLATALDKVPIEELNIETIYIDGNKSSHFDVITDSYRIYKSIFKFYLKNRKKTKNIHRINA